MDKSNPVDDKLCESSINSWTGFEHDDKYVFLIKIPETLKWQIVDCIAELRLHLFKKWMLLFVVSFGCKLLVLYLIGRNHTAINMMKIFISFSNI